MSTVDNEGRLIRLEETVMHIKDQVDRIVPIATEIAAMKRDQANNSDAIKRAHARIDIVEADQKEVKKDVSANREEVRKWIYLGTGVFVAIGVIWTIGAVIIKNDFIQAIAKMSLTGG